MNKHSGLYGVTVRSPSESKFHDICNNPLSFKNSKNCLIRTRSSPSKKHALYFFTTVRARRTTFSKVAHARTSPEFCGGHVEARPLPRKLACSRSEITHPINSNGFSARFERTPAFLGTVGASSSCRQKSVPGGSAHRFFIIITQGRSMYPGCMMTMLKATCFLSLRKGVY